jgi:hypothetical protein
MCHCLSFGNVSLPTCKKYDICPSCDKSSDARAVADGHSCIAWKMWHCRVVANVLLTYSGNKCAIVLNFGNVSLPTCTNITFALVDKATLPELWQIWARLHSTHPVWNVGLTLGRIPSNIRPLLPGVLSLLTCPISARFPHMCRWEWGGGSTVLRLWEQSKFKCSAILFEISLLRSRFIHVAVTDISSTF